MGRRERSPSEGDGSGSDGSQSPSDSCESEREQEKRHKNKRGSKKDRSRSGNRDRDKSRKRSKERRGRRRSKTRSRSASREEERDPSPAYSVEDLWRRLEHLGSWKGLGKKEKMRAGLSGAERDELRRLEKKLEKRLMHGYRSSCIRTALMILEQGYEIQKDHMERMLAQCVQRPGINQVCMTLKMLQINPNGAIAVEPFLRGLGVLVQRNFPVQILRMWLNLGIPRDEKPLKDLPYDYDDEEKQLAAQELEDALGVITDDEEDSKGATRRSIFITGCKARPELNGKYERSEDLVSHRRPVYEKKTEVRRKKNPAKGKGKHDANEMKRLLMPHMMEDNMDVTEEVLVIHYRRDRSGMRDGWWISRNTCTGEGLAWNAREVKGPPSGGWFVIRDRQKLPDPLHIVDSNNVNDEAYTKGRKKEAMRALQSLDPNKLKGRLQTKDKNIMLRSTLGTFACSCTWNTWRSCDRSNVGRSGLQMLSFNAWVGPLTACPASASLDGESQRR